MSKQMDQGTRNERRIVDAATKHGRFAERLAKRGIKGEPDVRVTGKRYLPAVFWENWIKRHGQRRRAVRMVTLLESDYWKMVDKDENHEYGYLVQAKSTQTLSVRAVLENLIEAIEKGRYT